METRTLYRHIHGFRANGAGKLQKTPLMTIATYVTEDPGRPSGHKVGIGLAVCSHRDMPSRKRGRAIAAGRAQLSQISEMTEIARGIRLIMKDERDIEYLRELERRDMINLETEYVSAEGENLVMLKLTSFRKCSSAIHHIPEKTLSYLLGEGVPA